MVGVVVIRVDNETTGDEARTLVAVVDMVTEGTVGTGATRVVLRLLVLVGLGARVVVVSCVVAGLLVLIMLVGLGGEGVAVSWVVAGLFVLIGLDGRAVVVSSAVVAITVAVIVAGGGGGDTNVVVVILGSAVMVVGLGSTTEMTFVVTDGVALVTTTVSVTVGSEWTTVLVSTTVVAGSGWSVLPSPSPPSMGTTEYVALGASCGDDGDSAPCGHWKKGSAKEVRAEEEMANRRDKGRFDFILKY